MKIKVKLQLIIAANILLLVGIIFANQLWQKQAGRQIKQQRLVMELQQAIFEENRLIGEYFFHPEERPKVQFKLAHKKIRDLLEKLSPIFMESEIHTSINSLKAYNSNTAEYFEQLIRLDKSKTEITETVQALRERIISQIRVNEDLSFREGSRMLNAAAEITFSQNDLSQLYSYIAFGSLTLFIIVFSVIIIRSINNPLIQLHKGTEIIAGGNLDYKTNIRSADEIGQLSHAFDSMTERLRQITVSRSILTHEIEEHKLAEERLSVKTRILEIVFESAPYIMMLVNDRGEIMDINRLGAQFTGRNKEDLIGRLSGQVMECSNSFGECGCGQNERCAFCSVRSRVMHTFETGEPVNEGEGRLRIIKEGTVKTFDVLISTALVLTEDDRQVLLTIVDITGRKRTEEALKASEERLHLALDAAKAGTWEWDLRTNENYWSEELFRVYGLEPHSCEPSYESWRQIIHPQDREKAEHTVQEAAGNGTELRTEWRVKSQEGRERWLMSRGRPALDDRGNVTRYMGVVIDVTELKQAENALRASLDEKVALLKEVHHRVKNNLQIVASLLGLQARRAGNKELEDMLLDTRNRVKSMSLLHETLYRSGNLAGINFATYLKDLCGQLLISYSLASRRIRMEYHITDVQLSLEHAVPCGLIVSELVSNALKHGFPGDHSGRILVGMEAAEDQMLILSIEDDGIGLPANLDLSGKSTLGLKLVSGLVQQLEGRFEVGNIEGAGAVFRVIFPIPKGTNLGGPT